MAIGILLLIPLTLFALYFIWFLWNHAPVTVDSIAMLIAAWGANGFGNI